MSTEVATYDDVRSGFNWQGNYYVLDGYLKSNLNIVCERTIKKWDNLILIDGPERAGKTTLGKTTGAYLSSVLKRDFDVNSVFFSIDELIKYAQENRNKIILWDEAALGGMGQQWNTKEQMKLKQLMITCGKYGHILIFIIPDFTILGRYFGVHRSICLLRVYSPDMIKRGYFKFFNGEQKRELYDLEKRGLFMKTKPSFIGTFSANDGIMDEIEYEKKKDEAIQKIGSQSSTELAKDYKKRVYQLINYMHEEYRVPYKEISPIIQTPAPAIAAGINYYRKQGVIAGFVNKEFKGSANPELEGSIKETEEEQTEGEA